MLQQKVVVSGAGGQIAYSLLFRIASGELFRKKEDIVLHLLEVPERVERLKGLVMELEDCAFPRLKEVKVGSDPEEMFEGAELIILVGAKPRGKGMERKDLLAENGKIFAEQGRAINKVATRHATIFVVGNPCNTNCLITMHNAPDLARNQFYAMSRLDENRARYQLAKKAGVSLEQVEDMIVWGNHSTTQVPDIINAKIDGKRATDIIKDRNWLEKEFFELIQKRGAEVIAARGSSSAASAANAAFDGLYALHHEGSSFFSCAMISDDNPYGVRDGLIFSFPCEIIYVGRARIHPYFRMEPFLQEKLAITEKELLEERDMVRHLLS